MTVNGSDTRPLMKYVQARHRRSTLPGVCKERVFLIVAITNPFNNTVGTTRKEINTYENISVHLGVWYITKINFSRC